MTQIPAVQDTLSFSLDAETTITNNTVKFTTTVVAVIDGVSITEENLGSEVKKALNAFVTGEWSFQNPQRQRNDAGLEEARYVASLRASQSENSDVDNRRKNASRPGLNITNVQIDVNLPSRFIAEGESKLRVILLKRAAEQAQALSEASGREYRVHSLSYANYSASPRMRALTAGASSYVTESVKSAENIVIGHSQKLEMSAQVVLATNPPVPAQPVDNRGPWG